MGIATYIRDAVGLFFPEHCLGCSSPLVRQERHLCTACLYQLPYTAFHRDPENRVAQKFWGSVRFEHTFSYLYFSDGSRVQRILHAIKYQNAVSAAEYLGYRYGLHLLDQGVDLPVDCIVPVPLHKQKMRKRGYNQSFYFAKGLGKALKKTIVKDNLVRIIQTDTQTRKSKYERYENMEGIFALREPTVFKNRHILLVDDVVTTGSTLEACASAFSVVEPVRLSVATLACAR